MPEKLEIAQKRRTWTLPILEVCILSILAVIGTLLFYRSMDATLFQERDTHFVEISDTVTEVISASVKHYRLATDSAEYILSRNRPPMPSALPAHLEEIWACLELEDGIVLAFDSEARFYSSDGTIGYWQNAGMLTSGKEHEELITTLDYLNDGATYMLFLRKLDTPLQAGDESITHMAVAINVSVFQETFEMDIFQGQNHVYVVNPEGHRLFRHVCGGGFIDGYNILTALKPYSFIHGGSLEDLQESIANRESAGFEFDYEGEAYFVAASPVAGTDWSILTFVPTEILGAGTSNFLRTTVCYVSAIAVLVVLMMGFILYFLLNKRSDHKLIAYQQQANALLKEAAEAATK